MHEITHDLRIALRRLLKRPGFTVIAIISIGIGIGANTAIFSLVRAVALRSVPFERPGELVNLYKSDAGSAYSTMSQPDLRDLERETGDVFSGVTGLRMTLAQVDLGGTFESTVGELVTGNYFSLLGIRPLHGRTLLPSDDVAPGAHPVVVLSYDYWQRRYAGQPSAVGQTIRLNARPYTIVGIAPPWYRGALRVIAPSFYASRMMMAQLQPSNVNELEARGNQSTFAIARLKPGVGLPQAQSALERLAGTLRAQHPDQWKSDNAFPMLATTKVLVNPMFDRVIVSAAALLMVVVGLVLVIACANLASFLLAQAADRRKEVAVRLALGAGRGRLVRQFLTETSVLALLGGAAGLALALILLRVLVRANLPLPVPIALDLSLDSAVLAFTVLVTVVSGVAFGLAPALQATRPDIAGTIKDESVGGRRSSSVSLRSALVVVQVAVSLVLLVGSALFLRSFRARMDIDPGFGSAPAAMLQLQEPTTTRSAEQIRNFFTQLRAEVLSLPAVESVGLIDDVPLSALDNQSIDVVVPGIAPPPERDAYSIDWARVSEGFFEAAAIRLVDGRAFTSQDVSDGRQVAIVSEAFVRKFWPGQGAIGNTLRVRGQEVTVVGIAADAKIKMLGEAPLPYLYRPLSQMPTSSMTVIARTKGDPEALLPAIVAAARRHDADVILVNAQTMQRHLAASLLPHQLAAWIISAFGSVALVLASIGLFGVVSYAVSTRAREVGIRMALGADAMQVVRLMMGGGMRLVLIGGVIGLALSGAAAKVLSGVLYGVDASDPVAFLVAPIVLFVVASLAAWLPARRVTRINPVLAIRGE